MLLSVISRAHRGRKIGQRNISLLGHWWPEIRVAPRSSRRGRPGPAAAGAQVRPLWPPWPAGREVPEGPEVPEGGGPAALAAPGSVGWTRTAR
jgi:hypothetical protein